MPVGPPGGDVRELAADHRDPRRIYLGTADGILYRSDDGGLKWRRMSPGFPHRGASLDGIVADPRGALLVGFWDVAGSGGGVVATGAGCLRCVTRSTTTNSTGMIKTAINVAASMPPITVVPMIWRATEPAPVAVHSGTQPSTKAKDVIRMGRSRSRAAASAASTSGWPFS